MVCSAARRLTAASGVCGPWGCRQAVLDADLCSSRRLSGDDAERLPPMRDIALIREQCSYQREDEVGVQPPPTRLETVRHGSAPRQFAFRATGRGPGRTTRCSVTGCRWRSSISTSRRSGIRSRTSAIWPGHGVSRRSLPGVCRPGRRVRYAFSPTPTDFRWTSVAGCPRPSRTVLPVTNASGVTTAVASIFFISTALRRRQDQADATVEDRPRVVTVSRYPVMAAGPLTRKAPSPSGQCGRGAPEPARPSVRPVPVRSRGSLYKCLERSTRAPIVRPRIGDIVAGDIPKADKSAAD